MSAFERWILDEEENESEKNCKNGNSILVFETWSALNHALDMFFIWMGIICLGGQWTTLFLKNIYEKRLVAK